MLVRSTGLFGRPEKHLVYQNIHSLFTLFKQGNVNFKKENRDPEKVTKQGEAVCI